MVRAALAGVSFALLALSFPAQAQQAPAPDEEAPAAAPAAPAARPAARAARRKATAKNATEVVFLNNRASAVTAINMTGQSGKPSSMLKAPLAPGKKISVKLRKNAGCTFTLDASFDDEAPFEPTQVDLCADKTVNFTE